jgi:hypothetical protein
LGNGKSKRYEKRRANRANAEEAVEHYTFLSDLPEELAGVLDEVLVSDLAEESLDPVLSFLVSLLSLLS